ncbi:hypothetical protein CPC08DRAFT_817501 [Agrocybe pediades]|nr:hypothetical protein CPC08DRAFT_817501 [Agrocybe pediades]
MPTTRRQATIAEGKISPTKEKKAEEKKPSSTKKSNGSPQKRSHDKVEEKQENVKEEETGEAPKKKAKTDKEKEESRQDRYQAGTIERGHIYFFYRPRVQVEEVNSIDDIRNFHILLVPRPPEFAVHTGESSNNQTKKEDPENSEKSEQKVLARGADAVPAPDNSTSTKKQYRLITVGKKKLPDPESHQGGSRRKETFFAIVTDVGDNLDDLEKGLGEKIYQTKTRGERHEGPARLVARGGYAIVNSDADKPSARETHLGYHVSHPPPAELGDVQKSLGIFSASSFILQVKNPRAPANGPQQAHSKGAEYPEWIMRDIFGAASGHSSNVKGRENYGLRFASCETPELLNYRGADLILIASRDGEEGLETSLGDGRGNALADAENKEVRKPVENVFKELSLDLDKFPVESLEGSWI